MSHKISDEEIKAAAEMLVKIPEMTVMLHKMLHKMLVDTFYQGADWYRFEADRRASMNLIQHTIEEELEKTTDL